MSVFEIGTLDEFVHGQAIAKSVAGRQLVVIRIEDDLYVLDDRCSHEEFPLSLGEIDPDDCTIECERHGATFNLKDGTPLSLPATHPVTRYDVQLRDGRAFVEVSP